MLNAKSLQKITILKEMVKLIFTLVKLTVIFKKEPTKCCRII